MSIVSDGIVEKIKTYISS